MQRTRNLAMMFCAGLLAVTAVARNQNSPKQATRNTTAKNQDEETLNKLENEFSTREEQNTAFGDALADEWVGLSSNGRETSKTKFAEELERNRVQHNGPNPYTVQRKNMRTDLFGDTPS